MRLTPVDHPRGLLPRILLSWFMRRQFARLPGAIWSQLGIYWGLERGLTIDENLQFLVQTRVARLNGCTSASTSAARSPCTAG